MKRPASLYASFLLALFVGFMALVTPVKDSYAASQDQKWIIKGIKVDKKAKNAVIAREQAIMNGKRQAFRQLAGMILSSADMDNFEMPEDLVLNSLIRDFEIKNEQLSTTRYLAELTVRFARSEVEAYFGADQVTDMQTAKAAPILILPFWTDNQTTSLWMDPNPWKDVWRENAGDNGLVPVIVPLGDIVDIGLADPNDILGGDYHAVQKLMQRYETRETVIVMANMFEEKMQVGVYEFLAGGLHQMENLSVDLKEDDKHFADAVKKVGKYLNLRWKKIKAYQPSKTQHVYLNFHFDQLRQWRQMQDHVTEMDAVRSAELRSLRKGYAEMRIAYDGTENQLREALGRKGMRLSLPVVQDFSNHWEEAEPMQVYDIRIVRR